MSAGEDIDWDDDEDENFVYPSHYLADCTCAHNEEDHIENALGGDCRMAGCQCEG